MRIPMKDLPAEALEDFQRVREQFDVWRAGKQQGERIPNELWAAATTLYPRFSIHQISRSLRLDFVGLRDRLGIDGREKDEGRPQNGSQSPFIELARVQHPGPDPVRWSSCRISVKTSGAGRVRIVIRKAAAGVISDLLRVLAGWLG